MKDYKSRLINFLLKFNTGRTITDLQEARNILNLEVAQLPAPLAELLTPLNKPALSEAERPILANRLRKLFLLAYQDVPMALVCVAHHTARMQFIAELAPADSRWLAEQNQSIYLPLLQMLGLWKLRRQLGKKSIELLYNKELIEINQRQELAKSEQMQHLEPLISRLTAECNRNNLRAKILPYFSHPTTLYGHLMRGEALKELLRKPKIDVFVETEDDCYRLLGIIHRYTTPLAGRTLSGDYFRDLIASPRFNGYRALITTVSHPLEEGKLLLEFRIQTHEMDKINADGVLATHFSSPKPLYVKNAWWENQELLDFVNQNPRGQEKSDPEIYVFSPSGEVHRLPINSSPIDYAYKIHSEIGNHCKVMWVNGQTVGFEQELQNGDLVDVKTDQRYFAPEVRWLDVVKTIYAKTYIKKALERQKIAPVRSQELITNADKGRKIVLTALKAECDRLGLRDIAIPKVEEFFEKAAQQQGFSSLQAMYTAIANSAHTKAPSPDTLIYRFINRLLSGFITEKGKNKFDFATDRVRFTHFQNCCQTNKKCSIKPGQLIKGRVKTSKNSAAKSLVIYRAECKFIPPDQELVDLEWKGERLNEAVKVNLSAVDRSGLLGEVLQPLYDLYRQNIYLNRVLAEVQSDRSAQIELTIDTPSAETIANINSSYEALKKEGVISEVQIEKLSPLERLFLVDSETLHNPYTAYAVSNPRVFKGRETEIELIEQVLESDQNLVLLYGLSRMGKTSLMLYLQRKLSQTKGYVVTYLDVPNFSASGEATVWFHLAHNLQKAVKDLYPKFNFRVKLPSRNTKNEGFELFQVCLNEVKTLLQGRKLILMLDEISAVDEMHLWGMLPEEGYRLMQNLRLLIHEQRDIYFVLSVQETLYRSYQDNTNLIGAPLVRDSVPVRVNYLSASAAAKLVSEPVGDGLVYEAGVIEEILRLTACHPYYLQNLLYRVVNYFNKKRTQQPTKVFSITDLDLVKTAFLKEDELLFSYSLRNRTPHDYTWLKWLPLTDATNTGFDLNTLTKTLDTNGVSQAQYDTLKSLTYFRRMGIVDLHNGTNPPSYSIHVPLFWEWLQQSET